MSQLNSQRIGIISCWSNQIMLVEQNSFRGHLSKTKRSNTGIEQKLHWKRMFWKIWQTFWSINRNGAAPIARLFCQFHRTGCNMITWFNDGDVNWTQCSPFGNDSISSLTVYCIRFWSRPISREQLSLFIEMKQIECIKRTEERKETTSCHRRRRLSI